MQTIGKSDRLSFDEVSGFRNEPGADCRCQSPGAKVQGSKVDRRGSEEASKPGGNIRS